MFNPNTYQNSTLAGGAFLEVVQQADSEPARSGLQDVGAVYMPLRETGLSGSVTGPVARLQLAHHFIHPDRAEASGPVLEAVYRFPLPGDAAVTGVRVTFGETEIRAELADRRDAELHYDEARSSGRQALLVSRESPDVFSLHVSGIESGQAVHVVTDVVQSLRPERRGFTLRVPLTPAPRYTSSAGTGGRHEHGQPLSPVHDPGHRLSMDLTFLGTATVRSQTHDIEIVEVDSQSHLSLKSGEVIPDRDLVIEFDPPAEAQRPTLQVFHFKDENDYFLTLVHPPAEPKPDSQICREIILLVDRSGSMSGPKWQAADWTVRRFLSSLNRDDYFSIGLFHSTTRWFSRVAVPATPENVTAAQAFVNAYDDSGGTELETALEEALDCGRATGDRARHVVITTDAQVSNATDILALARSEARRSDRRRISLICIDAAPNSHLVNELASVGGGHASFLTSDPDEGDIATALDDLMELWGQPAAMGLSLEVNRSDVWSIGRAVSTDETAREDHERIDLGDLPSGTPRWVVARSGASNSPLSVDLIDGDGAVLASSVEAIRSDTAIKVLFGAQRLNALEYQLEPRHFSWRSRHRPASSSEKLRQQLVAESLSYGLTCAETSFVAVREEAGKLVQRGAIVPNALPYGWASEEPGVVYSQVVAREAPAPASMDPSIEFQLQERQAYNIEPPTPRRRRGFRTRNSEIRDGVMALYQGVPEITGEELELFQTPRFGNSGRLTLLLVSIQGDDEGRFDAVLDLYIGTEDRARASVRLRDLLDQRGMRPLNIRISPRDQLRLILRDASPDTPAPRLDIRLVWQ